MVTGPRVTGYLTSCTGVLKYGQFPANERNCSPEGERAPEFMTTSQPPQPPPKVSREQCKHPRVEIVSRDEDAEYVECKECGDVFESSEFKDMAPEEAKSAEEEV
jgi:hypothetical protein